MKIKNKVLSAVSAFIIGASSIGASLVSSLNSYAMEQQVWPVKDGILAYLWGYSDDYYNNTVWHTGIDIWSNGDDKIYSSTNGTVISVHNACPHWSYGEGDPHTNTYGNSVWIEDEHGCVNIYGHLSQNSIKVRVGDTVSKGTPIASMGSSGWSTGKHLHYEKRVNGINANTNPDVEIHYSPVPDPIIPIEKSEKLRIIESDGLNVRSEPSLTAKVLAAAPVGTEFTITKVSGNFGYTGSISSFVGNTLSNHAGWVRIDNNYVKHISGDNLINASTTTTTTTTTSTTTTTTTTSTTTTTTTTTSTTSTTTTTTVITEPLDLDETSAILECGEKYEIKANQSNLTYKSSNENVAVVSKNGVISAISNGTATITVINSNKDTVFFKVIVKEKIAGDTNCDETVNMADAVLIMQSLANPSKYGLTGSDDNHITAYGIKNGDMDGNGLTNADALKIQKYLLGIINKLD